jgi:chromosome segregation ATPase
MLDTMFRNGGERKLAEVDLRELIAEVRQERDALVSEREAFRAEIAAANGAVAKLARTNKVLDELGAKVDSTMRKVDGLADVAASYDERARRLEKLDQRVATLVAQLSEGEKAARELLAPEGQLSQHRKALAELGGTASAAQAELNAMRTESEQLAKVQEQLHRSTADVREAVQGLTQFDDKLGELRATEAQLRQEVAAARDVARDARVDAETAAAAAKEVSSRFESLAQLQELSKDTEKRIAGLHSLAEHVLFKVNSLETQKHAVDHATAETARLNQMVWAMDQQMAKLNEGQEKMQQAEQVVERIEQLARTVAQDLAAATAGREQFQRETQRMNGEGRALLESLRATAERLALEKAEYSGFEERLQTLSKSLTETETRMQAVQATDDRFSEMLQKADGLKKVFTDLRTESEDLARKQSTLNQLGEQLGQVEVQARRTAAQHASLKSSMSELEAMRADVTALHLSYADAARLRDSLAQDRQAMEAFAERTTAMIGRTPEIETRLQTLLDQMGQLEQGSVAANRLGESTRMLQEGLERVSSRLDFVANVGERVQALFAITGDVERKMGELSARRVEAEGLTQQCDSLSKQIALAHQQLEGLSSQQALLLPLAADVERLGRELQDTRTAMAAMKKDEAQALEQRSRLSAQVELATRQAADSVEQLRQLQLLGDSLAHVSGRSEGLMAELAQVQARQRDALAQVTLTEEQLQRAEAGLRQIEQRHALLTNTEKQVSVFESRLGELSLMAESLDKRMKSLADRESVVLAVKAEVDGIRQLASRSKGDLQFVAEHRQDVSDLRHKVDELLSRIGDTDGKIELIESWRKKVDEVHVHAQDVNNLLGEVQGTLENLSEQRVVIDDVGEKLARLDFTVQEAQNTLARLDTSAQESQNTLRTLQREREVAERVAASIKILRARGTTTPA